MQAEPTLTHRPRVLSVSSAPQPKPIPVVPTKSKLRRSLLGPIASIPNPKSDGGSMSNDQSSTLKKSTIVSPELPLKSPNRPSFRVKGLHLRRGSNELESQPVHTPLITPTQIDGGLKAGIGLADKASRGTNPRDQEGETDIPLNRPHDTNADDTPPPPKPTSSTAVSENPLPIQKSSFLEARNRFLEASKGKASPSTTEVPPATKAFEPPDRPSSVKQISATFDAISTASTELTRAGEVKPGREVETARESCATFESCAVGVNGVAEKSNASPCMRPRFGEEPATLFRTEVKPRTAEYGEGAAEASKTIDEANAPATPTVKEAGAVQDLPSEPTLGSDAPPSKAPVEAIDTNELSDLDTEFEICTVQKTQITRFPAGNPTDSWQVAGPAARSSPEILESLSFDAAGSSHVGGQTRVGGQTTTDAFHPESTTSEEAHVDAVAPDDTLRGVPISPAERAAREDSPDKPQPGREVFTPTGMVKSASDNVQKTNDFASSKSSSSQTSHESAHSEGGIITKMRNLYDKLQTQTRGRAPSGVASPTDPWGVSSLFQARPGGSSDATPSPPTPLPSKAAESNRFLYQGLPMVRPLSLSDMALPIDTRAACLYSVEELDADNVDWEFWGQVINNFDAMHKNNYPVLQRSVRRGVPVAMRGMVWQLLAGIRGTGLMAVYAQLLAQTSPHEKSITADLPRTFPQLAFFQSREGSGQESLFNVLKCYSLYDAEVGYCQGLSFLAGPLLLNMPDEEAFCVLVRMMEGLRHHFTPAMEGLQVRTHQFERLMAARLPQVHRHLQEQGIQSTMYASQWFMTLFAYRSSMRLVFRVLDVLLLEGCDILVKVALALLEDNADHILSCRFDELLGYLKSGIFDGYQGRTDHLLALACAQDLPERRMAKWRREYLGELAKRAEDEAYAASLQGVNHQLADANRDLNQQLQRLAASNHDLARQLAAQSDRNAALEHRLNEMEARLHTERQRAEAALYDQMDALAQKNLGLVTKNAALEDALIQAEHAILALKAARP
ncbi:GTPase-activating protein [Massospora cicadina]|nr:GTPase-activating protein [Massospora cicadina]